MPEKKNADEIICASSLKEAEEIAAISAKTADERKAENIITLKLSELSVVADFFVLCTANSEPHLKAVSERIQREVRDKLKVRPRAVEGKPSSNWIIIDFGAVAIHIMTPEMRDLYQLESLWGDAPRVEDIKTLDSKSAKKKK
jgi:ribosome-associated protein